MWCVHGSDIALSSRAADGDWRSRCPGKKGAKGPVLRHIYLSLIIYIYTHTYVCVYIYIYIYIYIYVCVYACIYIYNNIDVCTYIYIYMYTYIHIHISYDAFNVFDFNFSNFSEHEMWLGCTEAPEDLHTYI